jgi:hypothetical protein
MYARLISRILFACLTTALLLGLGSGCILYKKEKNFFLNQAPGCHHYDAV